MTEFHDRRTGNVTRIAPRFEPVADPEAGVQANLNRINEAAERHYVRGAPTEQSRMIADIAEGHPTANTIKEAKFDLNITETVPTRYKDDVRAADQEGAGFNSYTTPSGKMKAPGNVDRTL